MEIAKASIWKTPFIGAYSKVFGESAVVNKNAPQGFLRKIIKVLKVDSIAVTNIAGVHAVSSMISANSNFIIVPDTVDDEELSELKKLSREVLVVESKLKAWGNMMLLSDKGVLFSPRVSKRDAEKIVDSLSIDYGFSTLANYMAVGALAVTGGKICFVSKLLSEEEKKLIEDLLKLKTYAITVNDGLTLIRLGMLANSYGILVGESTTGSELMDISLAVSSAGSF
ncbi:MAG: translation initiation factor IF-6 [Candidatus Brockarchaeota archaeon]|nr:translation initiation factor IF-6 [Candidatus Brockarchaeota archaeon]